MRRLTFIALSMLLGLQSLTAQSFRDLYFKETGYEFDGMEKIWERDLFTRHKPDFGLSNDYEMKKTISQTDSTGKTRTKYDQYYKGYPVEGSFMMVESNRGVAKNAYGFIVKDLDINTDNLVKESDALQTALSIINAEVYEWEDATGNNPDLNRLPTGTLIITKKRGDDYDFSKNNYQ